MYAITVAGKADIVIEIVMYAIAGFGRAGVLTETTWVIVVAVIAGICFAAYHFLKR